MKTFLSVRKNKNKQTEENEEVEFFKWQVRDLKRKTRDLLREVEELIRENQKREI